MEARPTAQKDAPALRRGGQATSQDSETGYGGWAKVCRWYELVSRVGSDFLVCG